MTRMKPHREGFEDEEDCYMHYDPDKADERDCSRGMRSSILGVSCSPNCAECFDAWYQEEKRKRQEKYDALTPEEKAKREEFLKGLRELY